MRAVLIRSLIVVSAILGITWHLGFAAGPSKNELQHTKLGVIERLDPRIDRLVPTTRAWKFLLAVLHGLRVRSGINKKATFFFPIFRAMRSINGIHEAVSAYS